MNLFPEFSFGYADHTAWNEPNNILITLMGAALGMDFIEKHVTNVYGKKRVDWESTVSIDMFNEIADKLEILSNASLICVNLIDFVVSTLLEKFNNKLG